MHQADEADTPDGAAASSGKSEKISGQATDNAAGNIDRVWTTTLTIVDPLEALYQAECRGAVVDTLLKFARERIGEIQNDEFFNGIAELTHVDRLLQAVEMISRSGQEHVLAADDLLHRRQADTKFWRAA